jgi:DNA mismatch repair protein MutH
MVGFTPPPRSLAELQDRADRLAGLTVEEVRTLLGRKAPLEARRAKGYVGELVEAFLGASAGSRAEPDFPELGVELKTLPVGPSGKPTESTFVCTLELGRLAESEWESSRVRKKLERVLWVPVEGQRSIPLTERHFGTAFFWQASQEESALLRGDWEELVGLVSQGRTAEITGHMGRVLQVRPKAASSRAERRAYDEDGAPYSELPRGFYLRATFTSSLLDVRFARPGVGGEE